MSTHLLGKTFDIHGGGYDLIFPHHQNEIAQSEGAHQCKFVNKWMHVGYVQINKEKMSKSLGNFFTIREVIQQYDPEIIRYFMLASHYRSPINYSLDNLSSAHQALERFYTCLRDLPDGKEKDPENFEQRFHEAMDDDFNTPVALAVLFEIVREINKYRDHGRMDAAMQLGALLRRLGGVLGLLQQDPENFLQVGSGDIDPHEVEALIEQRKQARADKSWDHADAIRIQLHDMGVELEDTSRGTIWRRRILMED